MTFRFPFFGLAFFPFGASVIYVLRLYFSSSHSPVLTSGLLISFFPLLPHRVSPASETDLFPTSQSSLLFNHSTYGRVSPLVVLFAVLENPFAPPALFSFCSTYNTTRDSPVVFFFSPRGPELVRRPRPPLLIVFRCSLLFRRLN